jgi:hypothetical protein
VAPPHDPPDGGAGIFNSETAALPLGWSIGLENIMESEHREREWIRVLATSGSGGDGGDGSGPPNTIGFQSLLLTGEEPESIKIVPPSKILYVFLGNAAGQVDQPNSQRIFAKWIRGIEFKRDRIYIRAEDGLYESQLRTLVEFQACSPQVLWRSNQSVIVNPLMIHKIDTIERPKKIYFYVKPTPWSWNLEQVTLSKTFLKRFRRSFAIGRESRRVRSSPPPETPMIGS